MSKYLIYGLVDPRTGLVRYIGKSSTGLKRSKEHGRLKYLNRDFTHKANWIRELLAAELAYDVHVLEELPDASGLNAAEIRWIAHGRAEGWPLTNLTDGGDGLSGCSEELRERLRKASTGKRHTAEAKEKVRRSKLGKPRTEAERLAISAACRRSEAIAKMSAASKARIISPEVRARMSESHRGLKLSDETRAKLSAAHKGRKKSPETCAKIAAAKKGKPRPDVASRNQDPAFRALTSAGYRGTKRPDLAARNASEGQRQAVAAALKGRVFSEEHRAKLAAAQQRRRERERSVVEPQSRE